MSKIKVAHSLKLLIIIDDYLLNKNNNIISAVVLYYSRIYIYTIHIICCHIGAP